MEQLLTQIMKNTSQSQIQNDNELIKQLYDFLIGNQNYKFNIFRIFRFSNDLSLDQLHQNLLSTVNFKIKQYFLDTLNIEQQQSKGEQVFNLNKQNCLRLQAKFRQISQVSTSQLQILGLRQALLRYQQINQLYFKMLRSNQILQQISKHQTILQQKYYQMEFVKQTENLNLKYFQQLKDKYMNFDQKDVLLRQEFREHLLTYQQYKKYQLLFIKCFDQKMYFTQLFESFIEQNANDLSYQQISDIESYEIQLFHLVKYLIFIHDFIQEYLLNQKQPDNDLKQSIIHTKTQVFNLVKYFISNLAFHIQNISENLNKSKEANITLKYSDVYEQEKYLLLWFGTQKVIKHYKEIYINQLEIENSNDYDCTEELSQLKEVLLSFCKNKIHHIFDKNQFNGPNDYKLYKIIENYQKSENKCEQLVININYNINEQIDTQLNVSSINQMEKAKIFNKINLYSWAASTNIESTTIQDTTSINSSLNSDQLPNDTQKQKLYEFFSQYIMNHQDTFIFENSMYLVDSIKEDGNVITNKLIQHCKSPHNQYKYQKQIEIKFINQTLSDQFILQLQFIIIITRNIGLFSQFSAEIDFDTIISYFETVIKQYDEYIKNQNQSQQYLSQNKIIQDQQSVTEIVKLIQQFYDLLLYSQSFFEQFFDQKKNQTKITTFLQKSLQLTILSKFDFILFNSKHQNYCQENFQLNETLKLKTTDLISFCKFSNKAFITISPFLTDELCRQYTNQVVNYFINYNLTDYFEKTPEFSKLNVFTQTSALKQYKVIISTKNFDNLVQELDYIVQTLQYVNKQNQKYAQFIELFKNSFTDIQIFWQLVQLNQQLSILQQLQLQELLSCISKSQTLSQKQQKQLQSIQQQFAQQMSPHQK